MIGMRDAGTNAAVDWFGADFARLHPSLQGLHREGGKLRGKVAITAGRGVAGVLGRRIARRLGIPTGEPLSDFEVRISHDAQTMRWERHFGTGRTLLSVFRPVGQYPGGYWLEDTVAVRLKLTVDLRDGGWYWRLQGASLRGMPLPLWLFRGTEAYKSVDAEGGYRFAVAFAMFPFGVLLRYEGVLWPARAVQTAQR